MIIDSNSDSDTAMDLSFRKNEKSEKDSYSFSWTEAWDITILQTDDSKFVKNLATAIWSRPTLANHYIKFDEKLIEIPRRFSRKILTTEKKCPSG